MEPSWWWATSVLVFLIPGVIRMLRRRDRSPAIVNVLPDVLKPGQQADLVGTRLDEVQEVLLSKGSDLQVIVGQVLHSPSRLTITIHDAVKPGRYALEFRTSNGEIHSSGRVLRVESGDHPTG